MKPKWSLHIKWCFISWRFRQTINHALQKWHKYIGNRGYDFQRSCKAYFFGNMSYVYWYRHWYATRLCFGSASGLLRLEELVRRFLISRETLSVRMLDDNLDPTPLLKEIRDDKVATIIIDANASVSYLILKKVRSQGSIYFSEPPTHVQDLKLLPCTVRAVSLKGICVFFSFVHPFGKFRLQSRLAQSSTGCSCCYNRINIYFYLLCPRSSRANNIYASLPATITYSLKKVFDKRTSLAGMRCRCYPGLVWFIVRPVMPIASPVSHSVECVRAVFTGHIGADVAPQRNIPVLAWWCKTVINVCCPSPPPHSLPLCPPTVSSALCFSITPLLGPRHLSLHQSPPHPPSFSASTSCIPPQTYFFILCSLFLFRQASELGMTSAFYKYILTTMVRVLPLPPFLSSFPRRSLLPLPRRSSFSVSLWATEGAKAEKVFD